MSEDVYIPAEDVTGERDGVQYLIAAKGVPISMAEARKRGLVKDQQRAGPSETKAEGVPVAGASGADITFTPAPAFEEQVATADEDAPQKAKSKRG